MNGYSAPLINRPPHLGEGEIRFFFPKSLVQKKDETVLSTSLIANRPLFGECYRQLANDFFYDLGQDSGVMIARCVPSHAISKDITFPGDVDLLIIPYNEDQLLLSKTMVIEVKAVRASFSKQGKSPNEYGFSQASALLKLGFPYVAVAHLIVSDSSPKEFWRKLLVARVKDSVTGTVDDLKEIWIDMLPSDLMDRSYGRLVSNCPDKSLGLLSAYPISSGCWMPNGRPAIRNKITSPDLLYAIEKLYNTHFNKFFDTRKWPPKK